jgi:hypothetical protein
MAILSPTLKQRFFTSAGLPLVGGKLYTYAAGTTTPLTSYSDATESVANSNPIILDADGECDLWLGSSAYKMVLTDSADVTQWTTDNVNQASESLTTSPDLLQNFGISSTVSTNILTVNLTTAGGATPTALNPVRVGFRSNSLTSGSSTAVAVTSSLGMTVSNGSTLGHANGVVDYVYVYLLNNNGTAELAVSSTLYPETAVYTTVAEGGAGAADSRTVIYSIAARTNVPLRLVGRLTVNQATAGAWASAPTQIQAGAISQLVSSLSARYNSSAGQSITASTDTIVDFGTKDYDSHNAVTTGGSWKFTAPISGKYKVSALAVSGNNAWTTASQVLYAVLYKNGSAITNGPIETSRVAATFRMNAVLNTSIDLLAGDYIDVRVFQSLTASLFASAQHVYVSIEYLK